MAVSRIPKAGEIIIIIILAPGVVATSERA